MTEHKFTRLNNRPQAETSDIISTVITVLVIWFYFGNIGTTPKTIQWIILFPHNTILRLAEGVGFGADIVILYTILVGYPVTFLYWVGMHNVLKKLIVKVTR